MYVCHGCKGVSLPGQQGKVWVSQKRVRRYQLLDREGNQVGTTTGWEIEREQRLCAACYEEAVKADALNQPQAE